MDDNPVERLLTVLPSGAEMPAAAVVRRVLQHIPGRWAGGRNESARKLVSAVTALAEIAEEARLPLALPARFAAKRLAAASPAQVLAWMRTANPSL